MFFGKYAERPYTGYTAEDVINSPRSASRLTFSNAHFDPEYAARLFDEHEKEHLLTEGVGFDGICLNEHHNSPSTLGSFMTGEACALARLTKRAKIVLLGSIIGGVRDNPIRLAEEMAVIDLLSKGRLISGFARGGDIEMAAANTNPVYNREMWQETHDLIMRIWREPGPWRWEGKHYQFRVVCPFVRPLQKPHPPVWIPGNGTVETLRWCAEHRYPYIFLETAPGIQKERMKIYADHAEEMGYKAGPQHFGYLIRTMVAETDEQAREASRGFLDALVGIGRVPLPPEYANPQGTASARREARVGGNITGAPGAGSYLDASDEARARVAKRSVGFGLTGVGGATEDEQLDDIIRKNRYIVGSPETVIEKFRELFREIPVGTLLFWTNDGTVKHEDAMRNIRLLGKKVIPALRKIAKDMGLAGPPVGANGFERGL
jgi:alkanesulfonate monooxygenase SsuD/methylene tetrahydromethanopterin reductase-like flavin-dependent oxidoreductase (luciferase family)